MSEWTIKLPIAAGEMLHVDLDGQIRRGYRIVPEDPDMPQTVVSGIEEAVYYTNCGLSYSECLQLIADLASSISDEIKAKDLEESSTAWIYDRRPSNKDMSGDQSVWIWSPGSKKAMMAYAGDSGRVLFHGQPWAPLRSSKPTTAPKYDSP